MNFKIDLKPLELSSCLPKYSEVSPYVESKLKELRDSGFVCTQSAIDKITLSSMEFIGSGNFGKVYKKDNKTAIKISSMLKKINYFVEKSDVDSVVVDNLMKDFDNEHQQILSFSELKTTFPNNILDIYEVKLSYVEGKLFPSTIITMEYIEGVSLDKFIAVSSASKVNKIVHEIMTMLMYANLSGYFHNDISHKNIIVQDETAIIVDYNFSKKISETNKYPIECSIFMNEIKKSFFSEKTVTFSEGFMTLLETLENFNEKYCISDTVFYEKIIFRSGVFTKSDYENLPDISKNDEDEINLKIDKIFSSSEI